MKGALMPLVLLPRYTTLLQPGTFITVPMNVEPYSRVVVTLWRGHMPANSGTATFEAYFEDSHDADTWTPLVESPFDPGPVLSTIVPLFLRRRWLRLRVVLGGEGVADTGVTCWAVGTLEERVGSAT